MSEPQTLHQFRHEDAMIDRRQFLTSLAVAVSGKTLVVTEGVADSTSVTAMESKTKKIVTLHFNDLPVLLGGEESLLQVSTPFYTCPHTKRMTPTRYTTVTVSRAVGPKATWDEVFRTFANVLDYPKNTLTVKLGDETLVTLDNAILQQIGVQYEAQGMLLIDSHGAWENNAGFGALSLIGTWREQRAKWDEYEAAQQKYVEAQERELAANTPQVEWAGTTDANFLPDGDEFFCEDCNDTHA